jgi:hypothetical protein
MAAFPPILQSGNGLQGAINDSIASERASQQQLLQKYPSGMGSPEMLNGLMDHLDDMNYWPAGVPHVNSDDTKEQANAKTMQAFKQILNNSINHEHMQLQRRAQLQNNTISQVGQSIPLYALAGLGHGML